MGGAWWACGVVPRVAGSRPGLEGRWRGSGASQPSIGPDDTLLDLPPASYGGHQIRTLSRPRMKYPRRMSPCPVSICSRWPGESAPQLYAACAPQRVRKTGFLSPATDGPETGACSPPRSRRTSHTSRAPYSTCSIHSSWVRSGVTLYES